MSLLERIEVDAYEQHINKYEYMLEPRDLGAEFKLSAVKMNKKLEELGLQKKVGKSWIATEEGQKISVRNKFETPFFTGYNLKWDVVKVRVLMRSVNS